MKQNEIEKLRGWSKDVVISPARIIWVDLTEISHWRIKVGYHIKEQEYWQDIVWKDFPSKSRVQELVTKASRWLLAIDTSKEKPLHDVKTLDIVLHFFCASVPHPRVKCSVGRKKIERLVNDGMLTSTCEYIEETQDGVYYVTKRAKAWMEAVLSVPYPMQDNDRECEAKL